MSTAENFVAAMKDSLRVVLIGRPTGGASGNPVRLTFEGDTPTFQQEIFNVITAGLLKAWAFTPTFRLSGRLKT